MWFLASFDLGPGISYGYTGHPPTGPTATWITTPDDHEVQNDYANTQSQYEGTSASSA